MSAISPPKARGGSQLLWIAFAIALVLLPAGWMGWLAWRSDSLRAGAAAAVERQDWDRAGDLLGRLDWYDPDNLDDLSLRVQVAIGRGDPVAAARLLDRVPAGAPGAVEARLSQGRMLIEAFRPREAEAALRACLRLDPDSDAARLTLIAIYAIQRRDRDYEAEAWTLARRGAEPIKALRLIAQAAPAIPPDTLTRTADEGDVLRRCLAAEDDVRTRVALAYFERRRGRIDEALALIGPCLESDPDDPDVVVEWASCLLDDGRLEPVRATFESPSEALRGRASFWMLRGEWARRQGKAAEALESYREAVRLDPRSPDARYRLGMALREAGPEAQAEADRCLDYVRRARELKDAVAQVSNRSRDPDQLADIGRRCAEMGRDREARAWYGLALKADPAHAAARAGLEAVGPEPPAGQARAAGGTSPR